MKKVFITGIAGFIGSHVADRFSGSGWEVAGIDDLSTGKFTNITCKARWEIGDIRSWRPDILEAIGGVDVFVHLAAQPSLLESEKNPYKDASINIIGTINAIQLAKIFGAEHFIFSSTSAVYNQRLLLPISEDDYLFPESNYGTSKLAAEFYIRNSLSYSILRFGNVFGPRQVPLGENQVIPRLLSAIYNESQFEIYGDGYQMRDYVYVKDVADAVYMCATEKAVGTFNVSTGVGTTTNALVDMVCKETGADYNTIPHTDTEDDRNVVLSNNKIREYWQPTTPLLDGLRETIQEWPK